MTTIPRNHTKVIAELKAQYSYAIAHHKNDSYIGRPTEAQTAWDTLSANRSAVLTRGSDRLTIRHPLGWFALYPDQAAYTATLPAPPEGPVVVFPAFQHRARLGELRRAVPGEAAKDLLLCADHALATAAGAQALIALLAAMAHLEHVGHRDEAAVVEAIADELAAALATNGGSR